MAAVATVDVCAEAMFQTALTCNFQLPETEIPQKSLMSNFLHNQELNYTCRQMTAV